MKNSELKLLLEAIPFKEEDVVFLSGSHAEGWANTSSDYDFYVIGNNHDEIDSAGGLILPGLEKRVKRKFFSLGDSRFEAQYWNISDVLEIAEHVKKYVMNPLVALWPDGLELLHRLRIGIPVHNEKKFLKIQSSIDFKAFELYLAHYYMRVHQSFYYDAVAALDSNQIFDAVLMARMSTDYIVDAYLAIRHQTNPQTKWRNQKLKRLTSPELHNDYLRTMCLPSASNDQLVIEHIVENLTFAETVSICIQLSSNYEDIIIKDQKNSEKEMRRRLGVKLRRKSEKDIILYLNDGSTFKINETAAIIWSLLNGSCSTSSILHFLQNRYGRSIDQLNDDLNRVMDSFYKNKLLM